MSNARNLLSGFVGLAMLAAGVALIGYFFVGLTAGGTATNSEDPSGFNVPRLETGEVASGSAAANGEAGPEDKTLKLTVPAMSRIEDDEIPNTTGGDEASLKNYAAIHLEGTGFPWQDESNVYIAGHRLGYPNTDSFLAFWDREAEPGDLPCPGDRARPPAPATDEAREQPGTEDRVEEGGRDESHDDRRDLAGDDGADLLGRGDEVEDGVEV